MDQRTEQVFQFIGAYWAKHGLAPSYREIADGCHLSTTSLVRYRLDLLEHYGLIQRKVGVPRSITITEVGHAHLATD